jgi:hypothetical protein
MLAQLQKAAQPDPQAQQAQMMGVQLDMADKQAKVEKTKAETQKITVEAQLMPSEVQAKVVSALSNNLNEDAEGADFERRAKIAELMLKERDIESNHDIAKMQMAMKSQETDQFNSILKD